MLISSTDHKKVNFQIPSKQRDLQQRLTFSESNSPANHFLTRNNEPVLSRDEI